LPKPATDFLPAFRLALSSLPESNIVTLALSQPAFLGLTSEESVRLQLLCAERYRLIYSDPVFRRLPSSLPYCYSEHKPTNGLALVYRPKQCDSGTPCLVFLHGYGGSFLWCQHLLAEAFPDYLILCPAYGISSASVPPVFIAECIEAVRRQLGHAVARPSLVGLSAGGFGAIRVYTQLPDSFSRVVVLGAYPPQDAWPHLTKKMSAYFLVGIRESYVQSGAFQRQMESIRPRLGLLQFEVLPDTDHFFLLAKREQTVKILGAWLKY
jgi:pimeloyl-ACP methyl ester carboxylesterase